MITEKIIERLEQGEIPWKKPWAPLASTGAPRNLITDKPYRGINIFILASEKFSSPYWLTYRQAMEKGGTIRKGAKGTVVVYWNWIPINDKDTGEEKEIPFLRHYTVFNLEQTDGIEAPPSPTAIDKHFSTIEEAENIIDSMPQRPVIRHEGNQAGYNPGMDYIVMPPEKAFFRREDYYCTLFHEISHSTGHISRLGRKGVMEKTHFGSHEYSKEELVAEMAAAFLCAEAGIEQNTIDNSAAYIQSWLKQLKNDKSLVIMAAGQAQKAADFILNRNGAETQDAL
ncbi:MAG: zincin-like metallopeptidase domain-containing protein [Geobacteraceae bacterium]|nr:zincin-like metallopeptidase domain-containing protein [Geobacteraceae bacterium]